MRLQWPKGHSLTIIYAFQPSLTNFTGLLASSSAAIAALLEAYSARVAFNNETPKLLSLLNKECS